MTDRFLFDLAPDWALRADVNQWMLLRARKRHAGINWQPVSYIESTKTVLRRCMRENGVQATSEAEARLDGLPERFLDFVAVGTVGKR